PLHVGCIRAAADGRPKHSDEYRHRRRETAAEMQRSTQRAAIAGGPSVELLSTTMISVVRSEGRSERTRSIACASLSAGIMPDTRACTYYEHLPVTTRETRAGAAPAPHELPPSGRLVR